MQKKELGTKRKCESCNAKFYDLNRDPITCPKCNNVLVVKIPEEMESAPSEPAENKEELEEAKLAEGPEVISLEDVDSEQLSSEIQGIDDDNIGNEEDNTYIQGDDESDMAEIVTGSDDDNEN